MNTKKYAHVFHTSGSNITNMENHESNLIITKEILFEEAHIFYIFLDFFITLLVENSPCYLNAKHQGI